MVTAEEAARLLDVIAERTPKLRDAGVTSVAIGDIHFAIAAHTGGPLSHGIDEAAEPVDPLDDPATFGLPPGARVPAPTWAEPSLDDEGPDA